MRSRISCLVIVGCTLARPEATLAETGTKEDQVSLLDDARLEGVSKDLDEIFDAVEKAGLPREIFEAKVREGLVKKIKPSKILAALKKLEGRCLLAAKIISDAGLKPSASSIGSMADLMASGASEADASGFVEGIVGVDGALLEKALVVAVMIRDAGATGPEALGETLAIVHAKGGKGLDAWMKKASKAAEPSSKAQGPSEGSKKSDAKKEPKGKFKGKGLFKSQGPSNDK